MAFVGIDTSTLVDHAVPGPCCGIYDMPLFVGSQNNEDPLPWRCVFNQYTGKNECVRDSTGTYPTFAECAAVCNPSQANPNALIPRPNYKYVEAPEPCFTDMCCPCGCCRNSEMPKGFWVTVENMYLPYSYGGTDCKILNDGTYYAKVGYTHVKSRFGGVETEYYTQGDACVAGISDQIYFEPSSSPCYSDRDFTLRISFSAKQELYNITGDFLGLDYLYRCTDPSVPQQEYYDQIFGITSLGATAVDSLSAPITPVFFPSLGTKIDYSCNCNCTMYVTTNSEPGSGIGLLEFSRVVTPIYNALPALGGSRLFFVKPLSQVCADWSTTYTASDFHVRDTDLIVNPAGFPDPSKFVKGLYTGFDWKMYQTSPFQPPYGPGDVVPLAWDYRFAPQFFFTIGAGPSLSDNGTKITITPDYTGGPYATCYPIMSAESASGIMSISGVRVGSSSSRKSLEVLRPDRCEYLGKRTELRGGCNGWQCLHKCDLGLPAVPGGYCQGCESYAVDPDFAGKGVAGWLQ